MWEKEWTVTVVPRSPVQSLPFRLRACVLPWTLGLPAARPLDSATRVTRGEFPPQPRPRPFLANLLARSMGAWLAVDVAGRRGAGRSSGPGAPSVAPHLCLSRSSARGSERGRDARPPRLCFSGAPCLGGWLCGGEQAGRPPGAPSEAVTPPVSVSAEPPVSGLQPTAPAPAEDVNSDDSDEIVLAPSLPTRKSASPR